MASINEAMKLNNEIEWLECAMHLEAMMFTLEPAHMPEMIEYIKGAGVSKTLNAPIINSYFIRRIRTL